MELGEDEGNYIQVHADEHGNLIQDEDGNLIQYVPMEEDEGAQEGQEEVSHQHVEQIVDEHGEVCRRRWVRRRRQTGPFPSPSVL